MNQKIQMLKFSKWQKYQILGKKVEKLKNQISKLLKVKKNNKELDDLEPRINNNNNNNNNKRLHNRDI